MSLKAEGLTYLYEGEQMPALDLINIGIGKGELVLFCGKNGSGKSTLLRCMAGLAKPSGGSALIDGENAHKARQKIGFAIQFPERALFARTIYDDLAFAPRNMGMPEKSVQSCVENAVRLVGLEVDLHTSPRRLSYGQKRLAAFACAVAHGPEYLFLDEPGAGLDYCGKQRIARIINELSNSGKTIVIATHDPLFLLGDCTRIVLLEAGRVVTNAQPLPEAVASAGITSDTLALAKRLNACGHNVRETLSPEELADDIAEVLGYQDRA